MILLRSRRWRAALLVSASLVTACAYAQAPAHPMQETMPPAHKAVLATRLDVTANGKTITYTPDQLQAMPQRQLVVHNGHTNVDETYTGVGLDDLLLRSGLTLAGKGAQTVYRTYIRAEGTDRYAVLFSASELEPTLHTGDSVVALMVDGKPLGDQGAFKLILAGEKKPARWVRNLTALRIVTVE